MNVVRLVLRGKWERKLVLSGSRMTMSISKFIDLDGHKEMITVAVA